MTGASLDGVSEVVMRVCEVGVKFAGKRRDQSDTFVVLERKDAKSGPLWGGSA